MKSGRQLGGVVLLVLGMQGAARAQPPPPDAAPPGPLVVHVRGRGAAPEAAAERQPLGRVVVHIGGRYAITNPEGDLTFDGIPEGEQLLRIAHPGYELVRQTLRLPAGPRAPLDVVLTAAPPVILRGAARVGDRPLPGARLQLTPRQVNAAVQGPLDLVTDWDGAFRADGALPPGLYDAEWTVAGCSNLQQQVTLKAQDTNTLAAALVRVTSTTPVAVRVTDAVTGQPLAGARVALAEAWPAGGIAQAVTDAQGQCGWPAIVLGRLNTGPADQPLPATRRDITLAVEADGHATAVLPVRIGDGATLPVSLRPLAETKEVEPNNDFATATPLEPGSPARLAIRLNDDEDFFFFDLPHPAETQLALEPDVTMDTGLTLLARDGRELWTGRYAPRQQPAIQSPVFQLGAGRYYVKVRSWYHHQNSETEFALRLTVRPAVDAFEPNDTAAAARRVELNETIRGRIFPVGDQDHFAFTLPRPGRVQVRAAQHPLDRRVRIADPDGKIRGEIRPGPGSPGTLEVQLEAGEYRLLTETWYGDAASAEPYALDLCAQTDDGADDRTAEGAPPQPARTLATGAQWASTVFPIGDEDWYAVSVPGRGVMTYSIRTPLDGRLAVHDRTGKLRADYRPGPGSEASWELEYEQPDIAYLRTGSWYNNGNATDPYVLRADFTPGDEFDRQARNDTPDTATPADFGEAIRGTILPTGDVDVYRFHVDHPGRLRLTLLTPLDTGLCLRDAAGNTLGEWRHGPSAPQTFDAPVRTGDYTASVRVWYNNARSSAPYTLRADLLRADPAEREPLATDPPRPLAAGKAEPFVIEHVGDADRFLFETAAAGRVFLHAFAPLDTGLRVYDDRTGERVLEARFGGGWSGGFEAPGPARYRLETSVWYNNAWSLEPGWLLADTADRPLAAGRLAALCDPDDSRQVFFTATPAAELAPVAGLSLDANGDGRADLDLKPGIPTPYRYAQAGEYCARLETVSADGVRAVTRAWVHAVGPNAREGVRVSLSRPVADDVLERPVDIEAQALSYTGLPVAGVTFALDGRPLAEAPSAPYVAALPWDALGAGAHVLTVVARDTAGCAGRVERRFSLSPYFELLPADGAVLSGEDVRVSWLGPDFGSAQVRYRPAGGTNEWLTQTGEAGRRRTVVLRGLEPRQPYEIQPLGEPPGPVRTVTRVKGLAFGKARYGATIERDYNQRVAVTVRNNGDQPLQVRLECGRPEDPRLLAGFVGEGSEDKPIPLGPGEQRDFLLGISAQDVVTADHHFPIRLTSDAGLNDEAEVAVTVRLPVVKLAWDDLGPLPTGLGRRYRLRNEGDALTDLALLGDRRDISVSPAMSHGLLPRGGSLEVRAYPVLDEGFQGLEGRVLARALDKEFAVPFSVRLAPGEKMFPVRLRPGADPAAEPDPVADALDEMRMLTAEYLDPDAVDWGRRKQPEDTDLDGVPDRWRVSDAAGDILWVGDDTDGDGAVDFVHADLGADGCFEFSAYRTAAGDWERTNLVEGWLEMSFALPWNREAYHPHDVDIVLNGVAIGKLRDALPEGNYTFRIPPHALRFGPDGRPENNRVGIKTRHLRGGHYVVNSDFRFRLRLTETEVWSPGRDAADARTRAGQVEGLRLTGADFSLSSSRLRLDGPAKLQAGMDVWIEAPVRNLGATRPDRLDAALYCGVPGRTGEEVARVAVTPVPLAAGGTVRLPWRVRGGASELRLVLDPDKVSGDTDPRNNEGRLLVQAEGDDRPPDLVIAAPRDGAEFDAPTVRLDVRAADETALAATELSVDGGLWAALPAATNSVALILQPGAHTLAVRARDAAGLTAEARVTVTVKAEASAPKIVFPLAGQELPARVTEVAAECPTGTVIAGARVNGGPWQRAPMTGKFARAKVPLRFGEQTIEVMSVDIRGLVGRAEQRVICTRQPRPGAPDEPPPPPSPPGWVTVPDAGRMDFFVGWNGVAQPPAAREGTL